MILPRVDLEVLPGGDKAIRLTFDPSMPGVSELVVFIGKQIELQGKSSGEWPIQSAGEQIQKQIDALVEEGKR